MNKRVWREHVRLVEDSLPRVANDGSGWGDFCIPAGADIFFLSSSPFSAFAFTQPTFLRERDAFIFSEFSSFLSVARILLRCRLCGSALNIIFQTAMSLQMKDTK